MAQSHKALRALAVRQGQDIGASQRGGFIPLSLGESICSAWWNSSRCDE